MPLYSFKCPVGHVSELLQGREVGSISCPDCRQPAMRQSVYHFNLGGGIGPKYRVSEFQEAAAEANYYHGRMEETKGEKIPRLDAVGAAKAKARARGAKVKV